MAALDNNSTWKLVSLLPGKRAISCKWVFKVILNFDRSIARLKTCLVTESYAQTMG